MQMLHSQIVFIEMDTASPNGMQRKLPNGNRYINDKMLAIVLKYSTCYNRGAITVLLLNGNLFAYCWENVMGLGNRKLKEAAK